MLHNSEYFWYCWLVVYSFKCSANMFVGLSEANISFSIFSELDGNFLNTWHTSVVSNCNTTNDNIVDTGGPTQRSAPTASYDGFCRGGPLCPPVR